MLLSSGADSQFVLGIGELNWLKAGMANGCAFLLAHQARKQRTSDGIRTQFPIATNLAELTLYVRVRRLRAISVEFCELLRRIEEKPAFQLVDLFLRYILRKFFDVTVVPAQSK